MSQAALEKGKNSEQAGDGESTKEELVSSQNISGESESANSLTSQMSELAVSANPAVVLPPSDSTEDSSQADPIQDIDKRIRALKKKVFFCT